MATPSFEKIEFSVRFSSQTFKEEAAGFNALYSSTLDVSELDPVFEGTKKTQVVEDVTDVLRKLIVEHIIIPNADHTDDPDIVIPPLFQVCPLSCCYGGQQVKR